jgi:hypothetical protein
MTSGPSKPQPRRFLIGAIVLALLVAAAAGFKAGASATTGSELKAYSNRTLAPGAAAAATPGALLQSIVARVNSGNVVATKLGGPPPGLRETDAPNVPNSAAFDNSLWLRATVRAAALTPEATTKPIWLGNLITGALRDEMFAAGQTPLYSSLISVALPDGSVAADVGGGVGAIQPGQIFSAESDATILGKINSAAAAAGFQIASVSIYHADQPAPAAVVTTTAPGAAAANPDAVLTAIFGPPGTYEGEYLEVRAADGALVFVQGSSFRTGVGQRWVDPAYETSGGSQPQG